MPLTRVVGHVFALSMLLGLGAVCLAPLAADAAGVVGDGTAANCTEAALDAALAGGGTVTFNCGPAAVVIVVTGAKTPLVDTTVDGGGLITLSGSNGVQVFGVTSGVTLTLRNLTLTLGRGLNGGCLYNAGSLNLTNVVVTM